MKLDITTCLKIKCCLSRFAPPSFLKEKKPKKTTKKAEKKRKKKKAHSSWLKSRFVKVFDDKKNLTPVVRPKMNEHLLIKANNS